MMNHRHDDLPRRAGENLSDATEREADLSPSERPNDRDANDRSREGTDKSEDVANEYAGRAKETWADVTEDDKLAEEGTRQRLEAEAGDGADQGDPEEQVT